MIFYGENNRRVTDNRSVLRIVSGCFTEEPGIWTDSSALVLLVHGGPTQMCACGKVNPPLWSRGPSADHHTLVNQVQTSATPLITLHLEEVLHIYHRCKEALRDLMIRRIPRVLHQCFLRRSSYFLVFLWQHKSSVPQTKCWLWKIIWKWQSQDEMQNKTLSLKYIVVFLKPKGAKRSSRLKKWQRCGDVVDVLCCSYWC